MREWAACLGPDAATSLSDALSARYASYAGAAAILLAGTWLFEEEMCRTSHTSRVACNLVPAAFYWIGALVAVVFGLWAAICFWRDTPGS